MAKTLSYGPYTLEVIEHRRVDGEDFPRPDAGAISEWFIMDVYRAGKPVDLYPNQNPHPHPDTPNRLTIGWVGRKEVQVRAPFDFDTGEALDDEQVRARRQVGMPIDWRVVGTKRGADFRTRFWPSVLRRIEKAESGQRTGKRIGQVRESEMSKQALSEPVALKGRSLDAAIEQLTGERVRASRQLPRGTVANIDTDYDAFTFGTSKLEGQTQVGWGFGQYGFVIISAFRFPLASITSGATINDVDLQYNQVSNTAVDAGDEVDHNQYGTSDPETDSVATFNANAAGSTYVSSTGHNANGSKTVDLGATADSDVASQLTSPGWFTVGIHHGTGVENPENGAIEAIANAGSDPATLIVDYTAGGGDAFEAEIDSTLEGVQASLNAEQRYTSQIDSALKKVTAGLNGVMVPAAEVDAALANVIATINAEQRQQLTVASTLKPVMASINVSQSQQATIGASLGGVQASLSAVMVPDVTIGSTLEAVAAALATEQRYTVTVGSTLEKVQASLQALLQGEAVDMTIGSTLANVEASMAAYMRPDMTVGSELAGVTASLQASQRQQMTIAAVLEALQASSTVSQSQLVTVQTVFEALTFSGTLSQRYQLSMAVELAAVVASLSASQHTSARVSAVLKALTALLGAEAETFTSTITLTGRRQTTIELEGRYNPTIALTGRRQTTIELQGKRS